MQDIKEGEVTMEQYQCPECKSSNVSAYRDEMRCWACGFSEGLFDYPVAGQHIVDDARFTEIYDRLNDLEAMNAEPSSVPRYYHDKIQQLQFELTNIRNKVNELGSRKKKKQETIIGITPL